MTDEEHIIFAISFVLQQRKKKLNANLPDSRDATSRAILKHLRQSGIKVEKGPGLPMPGRDN